MRARLWEVQASTRPNSAPPSPAAPRQTCLAKAHGVALAFSIFAEREADRVLYSRRISEVVVGAAGDLLAGGARSRVACGIGGAA